MPKYWIKIEEGVEGPYEAEVLKYIEGFCAETFVSPDDPAFEEIWSKATEVTELKFVFHPEPAKKPQKSKEDKKIESVSPEPLKEISDSQISAPPQEPIVPPTPVKEEGKQKVFPEQIQSAPATSISDTEMLDIMQILSKNKGKKEEKPSSKPAEEASQLTPTIPISAEKTAEETVQKFSEEIKTESSETTLPEERSFFEIKLNKKFFIVLGIILSLIVLGTQYKRLNRWVSQFKSDNKTEQTAIPAKEETKKIEKKGGNAIQPMSKKEKKTVQKTVKIVPEKPKETPEPKPVIKKEAVPAQKQVEAEEETDELKSQKYLLPGVLAPNIQSRKKIKKSTEESSSSSQPETAPPDPAVPQEENKPPETVSQKKSSPEEIKENQKKEKTKEQFDDVEWISQSGWGK